MGSVRNLEVFRYRLPLSSSLSLGDRTLEHREGLLIRLTANTGVVGWGEISPLPAFSRETVDEAAAQVASFRREIIQTLSPARVLEGLRADKPTATGLIGEWDLEPSVQYGLEQALLWLQAAAEEVSVPALLRNRPPDAVPLNSLIVGGSPEELKQSAADAVAEGYRAIKLKVGRGPVAADVEAVRTVDHTVRGKASLRLDANRAWRFEEARAFAHQISDCRIEYLEEPLANPGRLASLAAETSLPIALDETVRTISPAELSNYPFVSAVILKPTLTGGFVRSANYVRAARARNITPVISASFETGAGLSGLAWLAAGLDLADIPAGLDTWRWLAEDLLVPRFQPHQGILDTPDFSPNRFTINDAYLSPLP